MIVWDKLPAHHAVDAAAMQINDEQLLSAFFKHAKLTP